MKKVLIGVCLLAALFVWQGDVPDWLEEPASAVPAVEVPQPRSAYVYVSGAVRRPGLYAFDETVRVGEAVHAAGGVLPYADAAAVNFADEAADGMHIHIPYDLNGARLSERQTTAASTSTKRRGKAGRAAGHRAGYGPEDYCLS